ncbi:hypothetical protein Tco_0814257, partial [Tanacetum coccineum]
RWNQLGTSSSLAKLLEISFIRSPAGGIFRIWKFLLMKNGRATKKKKNKINILHFNVDGTVRIDLGENLVLWFWSDVRTELMHDIKACNLIPLGQKNTLAEYMILSGAENRPAMLDKDLLEKSNGTLHAK